MRERKQKKLILSLSLRTKPVKGVEKLMKSPMTKYYSRVDKYSCRVCGGNHNVVIIPLRDGSGRRRVIELPFPDTETGLAGSGLKLNRRQEEGR